MLQGFCSVRFATINFGIEPDLRKSLGGIEAPKFGNAPCEGLAEEAVYRVVLLEIMWGIVKNYGPFLGPLN